MVLFPAEDPGHQMKLSILDYDARALLRNAPCICCRGVVRLYLWELVLQTGFLYLYKHVASVSYLVGHGLQIGEVKAKGKWE